jgi:hypothetical protein
MSAVNPAATILRLQWFVEIKLCPRGRIISLM